MRRVPVNLRVLQGEVNGDHVASRMQSAHLFLTDQRLPSPPQAEERNMPRRASMRLANDIHGYPGLGSGWRCHPLVVQGHTAAGAFPIGNRLCCTSAFLRALRTLVLTRMSLAFRKTLNHTLYLFDA
jgi:hypothetical protein